MMQAAAFGVERRWEWQRVRGSAGRAAAAPLTCGFRLGRPPCRRQVVLAENV